ncbi:hypothetical protein HETIRDRAFT_452034 [Heterobasidion irregulare TC 32-1]|uniref:Uncharacterized protein n=1 Tax=Heterobasidion irregulare (strain TC 32-1) TaxID=747525 RepID=W4K3X3_HETIT|nr:uncharacterized protein HETIRDRAFT_452034 [Heterobasidion irregulare TC 32-1]ETW80439.1 hypothetical protein HETIRDRAFT_452034 [Heterobasidion irregulare TC 32-1]
MDYLWRGRTGAHCDAELEVDNLRESLRKRNNDLKSARSSKLRWKEGYEEQKRALEDARDESEMKTKQLDSLVVTLHMLNNELQMATNTVVQREHTISQLQTKNQALETTLAQNKALLDTRTRELEMAQAFLTKQETFTEKEIIEQIEALNYEIFQVAIVLSDAWVGKGIHGTVGKPKDESEQSQTVFEEVQSRSTLRIAQIAQSAPQMGDPLFLQIVFQAYLTHVVASLIMRWVFGNPPLEKGMKNVFKALRDAEPPEISGRWRALTHRYTQKAFYKGPAPEISLTDYLVEKLTLCVLCAALDRDHAQIKQTIFQKAGDGLHEVATFALKLNKIIGEEVTASMLSPMVIKGGDVFDARSMEDTFSDRGAKTKVKESVPVMCTTSMGLIRDVIRDDGKLDRAVLLRPKVTLESVLAVLVEK